LKCCDWIIDLGPEAGENGGELVFAGTPADLKKKKIGNTAKYL
jgi:excinuclease ABC subunit A